MNDFILNIKTFLLQPFLPSFPTVKLNKESFPEMTIGCDVNMAMLDLMSNTGPVTNLTFE